MEESPSYRFLNLCVTVVVAWIFFANIPFVVAQEWTDQAPPPALKGPWSDKSLPSDQRADLLVQQMTLEEKLSLVHGDQGEESLKKWLGGAGYVPGVPRLGIPALQMSDGRSGVANIGRTGRYATALPSALANAASWDLQSSYDFGALLGKEIRDLGFNVSLGGTANIIREPRNGRNYECLGEDPLLIGKMLGSELKGTQAQGVIGNINRYAVNDQDTGRFIMNVKIGKRAMQETDLLAFHIAIQESNVGTVMCAYNKLNSVYTCRGSVPAHRCPEEIMELSGLGHDGLGRCAQLDPLCPRRSRSGNAHWNLFRGNTQGGRGKGRRPHGALERHGASHPANRNCSGGIR